MGHARKDTEWTIPNGTINYEQAQLAVLMDLRDELKRLNRLLYCSNFTSIPSVLHSIKKNTKRHPTLLNKFKKKWRLLFK